MINIQMTVKKLKQKVLPYKKNDPQKLSIHIKMIKKKKGKKG